MFSGMRVGIVFRRCGAEFCFVSPVGARASAVLQSAQMAADQYCSAAVRDWAGASADGHVEVTPPSE